MKTTVIFHSADYDGLFCREIARKFLPDAELIGWDFVDAPLSFDRVRDADTVYVLDLPVDRPFGTNGFTDAITPGDWSKWVWIDHNVSSIASHPKHIPGYRIDGVAACRLAYQWFEQQTLPPHLRDLPTKASYTNRNVQEPLAVRLAGEYDIWDKRDPDAELFQHGLRSRDLTAHDWAMMLAADEKPTQRQIDELESVGHLDVLLPGGGLRNAIVEGLLESGKVLQYSQAKQNESIIKAAGFTIQFEGLTFLACNHARYNSFLFTAGLKPEHDACFGFAYRGGEWHVSLYHAHGKEHHDLSAIAVKYGGGGHKGACGMRLEQLPFL